MSLLGSGQECGQALFGSRIGIGPMMQEDRHHRRPPSFGCFKQGCSSLVVVLVDRCSFLQERRHGSHIASCGCKVEGRPSVGFQDQRGERQFIDIVGVVGCLDLAKHPEAHSSQQQVIQYTGQHSHHNADEPARHVGCVRGAY